MNPDKRVVSVRSYAMATFYVGRGIQPVGAEMDRTMVVFRFYSDEIALAHEEYVNAKGKLDRIADVVRGGGAA